MFNQEFSGLDVKISFPGTDSGIKRIKTPLSFKDLANTVKNLAQNKGLPVGPIKYKDLDGDWVVIEDEGDLELAYTVAMTGDKRITFMVFKPDQQASIPEKAEEPSKQKASEDVEMAAGDKDDFVVPVKQRRGKKNDGGNKGIPRKALKNLIAHELEMQAKETFETLMKEKSLAVG